MPKNAPHTAIEKIIQRNTGLADVSPGQIVDITPDRLMVHDIFVPFVAEKLAQMGFEKLAHPGRLVLVYDHLVPAATTDDVRHHQLGDAFAARYNVKNVHRSDGICHQLMVEQGYVKPGDCALGTDSHTTTYGAVGAFSTGIGYTEMAAALGTGSLWMRVPATLRVELEGALPPGVQAKDVILTLVGMLGLGGAVYRCLEFGGAAVQAMDLPQRMTLCNMAVEAGAKCALVPTDEKSLQYSGPVDFDLETLWPDAGAEYEKIIRIDAEKLTPVLACPSQVDKIRPASALAGTKVDQVFIGSCTNGRLEDLHTAAAILRGKKVAPTTRLIVTPASREIYGKAAQDGTLAALVQAGAILTAPGCGLCCGRAGGILAGGEVVVSTSNRNFIGRMGDATVQIYLASPAVAAATALAGEITPPPAERCGASREGEGR